MKQVSSSEFNSYITEQLGQPYVWGGQHLKLTPQNYVSVITKRETDEQHRADAIAYCKAKFDKGATVLYAYDCSGLGMYWLQNVKKVFPHDLNANGMMAQCEIVTEPKRGYWVFRLNNGKATHIGYMVDDEYLVEAKGRAYGVVKTKWRERDWDCWGIPKIFEDEIRKPTPPEPITPDMVIVKGKSVWVRDADSTKGKKLFVAHKGQEFKLLDVAPSGWYHILTAYPEAYITNKTRYTELL